MALAQTEDGSRITAWRCIGCGKIEAPQPCIGVCQDKKVELVDAPTYDRVQRRLEQARHESEALKALVRQLAHTVPRDGQWQQSYLYLQAQARRLLAFGEESEAANSDA